MGAGRIALVLIVALGGGVVGDLAGFAVAAQSPLAVSSQVETGWTSNASDSAAGGEDFYVSQSHELSLSGQSGDLLLRGSFALSQTRFATINLEDDTEVTGAV